MESRSDVEENASFEKVAFSRKTVQVPWEKVARTEPLIQRVLGSESTDSSVISKARKLEKFYPYLVSDRTFPSSPAFEFSCPPSC